VLEFVVNHLILESVPEVLYRDQWFYVVSKEREELSVPGRGPEKQDCLLSRAEQWLGPVYAVHRLDQPTSGLVLLARTTEAQKALSCLFEQRLVRKTYRARVRGLVSPSEGIIELPIRSDWERRPLQVVDLENGKEAVTRWKIVNSGENWSELDLFPETGRTHQLRVHLAAFGHPILGDRLYNEKTPSDLMGHLCLHASSLEFRHPFTDRPVFVEKEAVFPLFG
jgi:tRNA pseudouridine32 synthase/23S rRNA pseudouridine746 synthase